MTLRAFWHLPDGNAAPSTLVAGGLVEVPALITAVPGEGRITFEGTDGTRTLTSADVCYCVAENSGTEDSTLPQPGTPAPLPAFRHFPASGSISVLPHPAPRVHHLRSFCLPEAAARMWMPARSSAG